MLNKIKAIIDEEVEDGECAACMYRTMAAHFATCSILEPCDSVPDDATTHAKFMVTINAIADATHEMLDEYYEATIQ